MSGMLFGIFPGSVNASGTGLTAGPPDDPVRIEQALAALCPEGPFLVRAYVHHLGEGRVGTVAPQDFPRYIHSGLRLDLVLSYRPAVEDLSDWMASVRRMVREHGPVMHSLQVGEEPNNADAGTGGDGASPGMRGAVVAGVIAGHDEARRGQFRAGPFHQLGVMRDDYTPKAAFEAYRWICRSGFQA